MISNTMSEVKALKVATVSILSTLKAEEEKLKIEFCVHTYKLLSFFFC